MTSQTAPGTTYTYMMSDTYCQSWTAPMAIRELIANALDASPPDDVVLEWNMGMGYVENKGVLLQKEHLLLGESQKSTDQIGQFGEGLKLAALALCRDHRTVWVASGEHQYIFSIQHNTDFERNLLLVTISNNQQPISGTRIAFTCSQRDFDQAKAMFLKLQPEIATRIQSHSDSFILTDEKYRGDVYVLGVKVTTINNAIFGYDLADKRLINRDRTVVDHNILKEVIRQTVAWCDDPDTIKALLSACIGKPDCYEAELASYSTWGTWEDIVKELFGEKTCLVSLDHEANSRAQYLGYTVLNLGTGLNTTLAYCTKVPWAHKIVPPLVTQAIPEDEVPATIQKKIEWAKRKVYSAIGYRVGEIRLSHSVEGIGCRQGGIIFLSYKEAENLTAPDLFAALMHEVAHIQSNAEDCTGKFEAQLTHYFSLMATPKTRKPRKENQS